MSDFVPEVLAVLAMKVGELPVRIEQIEVHLQEVQATLVHIQAFLDFLRTDDTVSKDSDR